MMRFGVDEAQLRAGRCDDNFRALIRFEVDRAQALFDQGDQLLPLLDWSVRRQITLFGRGGRAVLAVIRRQNYDTLTRRPVLSRWEKGRLILGALVFPLSTRRDRRTPA
jgi:phytoene synthase